MTIRSVDDYIKAITINDTAKTKVESLESATLKQSKILSVIRKVTLEGKFTHIPFMHIPGASDTSFKIGAIDITKELKHSEAKLVDETDEDTTVNMESALDSILTSQTVLVAEKYLADYLSDDTNFPPASGASAKNFSTIVSAIASFPNQILAIEGTFVVLTSFPTYLAILATMDTAHKELIKDGIIKLVPVFGITNTKMVVLHTQGVAYGLDFKGVEKYRVADSQFTSFIPQFTIGIGADKDYVRNINLTA